MVATLHHRVRRLAVLAGLAALPLLAPAAPPPPAAPLPEPPPLLRRPASHSISPATRPAMSPEQRKKIGKAFEFLAIWQNPNGSWDRLENPEPSQFNLPSRNFPRHLDAPLKDQAENSIEQVADTCLAALAILQVQNDPEFRAKYNPHLLKAINFLCNQAYKWDNDSIYIQVRAFDPIHDPTPAAGDLRYYDSTVDTFFSLWLLSEVRGRMSDRESEQRIDRAIGILVRKIEKNQDAKGTWIDETNPFAQLQSKNLGPHAAGEAPARPVDNIATHAIATAAVNLAARRGVSIHDTTLNQANLFLLRSIRLSMSDAESRLSCLFALHHAELTARQMLAAARLMAEKSPQPIPDNITAAIRSLEKRLSTLSLAKRDLADSLKGPAAAQIPVRGIVLPLLPTIVEAVAEIDPASASLLHANAAAAFTQFQDGRLVTDPAVIHNQRGDNTFTTAASLLLLTIPTPSAPPTAIPRVRPPGQPPQPEPGLPPQPAPRLPPKLGTMQPPQSGPMLHRLPQPQR